MASTARLPGIRPAKLALRRPPAFAVQYMAFNRGGEMQEKETLDRLRQDYDVFEGPPGALTAFFKQVEASPQWSFDESLGLYNEGLQHDSNMKFFVHNNINGVQGFTANHFARFVEVCDQKYHAELEEAEQTAKESAVFMLSLNDRETDGDWPHQLNGYDRLGEEFVSLMRETIEEAIEEANEAANDAEVDREEERADREENRLTKRLREEVVTVSLSPADLRLYVAANPTKFTKVSMTKTQFNKFMGK